MMYSLTCSSVGGMNSIFTLRGFRGLSAISILSLTILDLPKLDCANEVYPSCIHSVSTSVSTVPFMVYEPFGLIDSAALSSLYTVGLNLSL
ncbi:hypothetical protein SDC9_158327 [bioreactor metagenome]|uniref:Uncharacterized protein n=1 Tax=bioreactor metagenome TaxID=1076179 RepID=A0A645FBN6_9ZZZZ